MALPTDEAARHREVAGRFSDLVRGTTTWDAPAPVEGWTARDVVEHLTTWLPGLLASVDIPFTRTVRTRDENGDGGSDRSFERNVHPVVAEWEAHAAAVQALLDDPASRERPVTSPHFPEMSLTQMIDRLYTTDVFMHSWDLARATGQPDRLDADHATELLAGMQPLDEMLRASGQYGPKVEPGPGADATDRLMAFVGRDPAWTP
ncbi:TIGR03086 family protein [Nocardioides sp. HDW12B]|uniref:TIGR03086 family metal-binding protein n=1 Tax=Nocardioides sp. HDW12B TaxID=2714939 RepID=UPI00140A7497|nr:TIGR03086 family metal-binding protein [Nocardioides sp. HDW12B]QIK67993.1 TIGR03086 family protein [Nocardioides sp. HDW12B]